MKMKGTAGRKQLIAKKSQTFKIICYTTFKIICYTTFKIICYTIWIIYTVSGERREINFSKTGTQETDNYLQKLKLTP